LGHRLASTTSCSRLSATGMVTARRSWPRSMWSDGRRAFAKSVSS
jgi:hypothetical protein